MTRDKLKQTWRLSDVNLLCHSLFFLLVLERRRERASQAVTWKKKNSCIMSKFPSVTQAFMKMSVPHQFLQHFVDCINYRVFVQLIQFFCLGCTLWQTTQSKDVMLDINVKSLSSHPSFSHPVRTVFVWVLPPSISSLGSSVQSALRCQQPGLWSRPGMDGLLVGFETALCWSVHLQWRMN